MLEPSTLWLDFARDDLLAAQVLRDRNLYHLACFHAQQCVEKLLKSRIAATGAVPPKTHYLTELINQLSNHLHLSDEQKMAICDLDDYYIPTRYPDALPGTRPDGLPGARHADEAIQVADMLFRFVNGSDGV